MKAATNAAKHSKADRIQIELTGNRVMVSDNGIGLPANLRSAPGMGRRIMRFSCFLDRVRRIIQVKSWNLGILEVAVLDFDS